MIYITGDVHGDFTRFSKNRPFWKHCKPTENDYVIICGDFGLAWEFDEILDYALNFYASRPYTLLWVQGNNENYNLIEKYALSEWNGGKVRHIIQDKVILLERGQVFNIEGKRFFTFGGADSFDIEGRVLDKRDPRFSERRKEAERSGIPYRIVGELWWWQELPMNYQMQEGRNNLEKVGYCVDYVITHCLPSSKQKEIGLKRGITYYDNVLTDYFEEIDLKLQYDTWFCGHYHENRIVDNKHIVLYESVFGI